MGLAWIVSLATALGQAAPAPHFVAEPIVTRQMGFSIPFKIDRPQEISHEPVEVQLHVSNDRGATWRLSSKVEPLADKFAFSATMDGEYWFVVRTVDRAGVARPEMSRAPILRVLIDTTPPSLQLTARRGQAGQVTAAWEIRDQRLSAESLRLHYRAGGSETWQPVAITAGNYRVSEGTQTGEVTWWPAGAAGILQMRAEYVDAAGNPSVSHAQLDLPPAALNAEATKPAAPETPAAAAVKSQEPKPAAALTAAQSPPATAKAEEPQPAAAPAAAQAPPAVAKAEEPKPAATPAAAPTPPAVTHTEQAQPAPATAAPAAPAAPAEAHPRMVNTRVFELEYDVTAAGPSGISRVELWGTRDGGKTWSSLAVDDDNRSPLPVKLTEDGIYGFRVAVRNGSGQGGEAPQSGDAPQFVLGVDATVPLAQIGAVQPVAGQPGQLTIAWQAADVLLAERPVTLSYAHDPAGPWTPIAAGLENTSPYTWTAPAVSPELVFLRLEVRDQAGNVAMSQTPGPVALGRQLPTAQIREVRPVPPGAGAPVYR